MTAETLYSGSVDLPAAVYPFLPEQLRRMVQTSSSVEIVRERRHGAVHTTFLDLAGRFAAQSWEDALEDHLDQFPHPDPPPLEYHPDWPPPFDKPFEPGELPDELPEIEDDGEPDFSGPVEGSDEHIDSLIDEALYGAASDTPSTEISADSETPEVVAWCTSVGVSASVVGMWVWADPYKQLDLARFGGRERFDALLKAGGFRWSGRRQSFFHACTISCKPGNKKRGGKLERFHSTCSAADYNPARHDPRPHHARKARKGGAK